MPTVLNIDGFRVFFYSNEGTEPAHVHVEKAGAECKWWLRPLDLVWNDGFKRPQLTAIRTILEEHLEELLEAWDEHFG
jgi:hypothetical protein